MIELVISGPPMAKGRPRFNRHSGRTYTPTETVRAEELVRLEWMQAGRPRLEGALQASIEAVFARPQNHWRKDGSLSSAGLRSSSPTKRPDWDNLGKLAADSLNGLAYSDDSYLVDVRVIKRWALPGEREQTRIVIWQLIRQEEARAA